jgi:hypothetical protein
LPTTENISLICSARREKRLRRSIGAAGRNVSATSRIRSRRSALLIVRSAGGILSR